MFVCLFVCLCVCLFACLGEVWLFFQVCSLPPHPLSFVGRGGVSFFTACFALFCSPYCFFYDLFMLFVSPTIPYLYFLLFICVYVYYLCFTRLLGGHPPPWGPHAEGFGPEAQDLHGDVRLARPLSLLGGFRYLLMFFCSLCVALLCFALLCFALLCFAPLRFALLRLVLFYSCCFDRVFNGTYYCLFFI